jgi:hypothetical protein
MMLHDKQLQQLARQIVGKRLPALKLDDVLTENTTISSGEAGLRITLVLTPESAETMSGDDVLKLLVSIREGLEREGEDRFPIVEYATKDDLAEEAAGED